MKQIERGLKRANTLLAMSEIVIKASRTVLNSEQFATAIKLFTESIELATKTYGPEFEALNNIMKSIDKEEREEMEAKMKKAEEEYKKHLKEEIEKSTK